tara:strand:- start:532 stop:747 length:216 start_codon:yes stop_codon:yes gene_type:complete
MSKKSQQLEEAEITLGEIDKAYKVYENSRDLFQEELLSLQKKLTLGQVISLYSILREELSVVEYDFGLHDA